MEDVPMPRFLAVYTMKPEDLASFRNLPKAEQDAVNAVGIKEWAAWKKGMLRPSLIVAELWARRHA
jgi:hypothetical protein